VEDDYFIAQDLCDSLVDQGAQVVGPASKLGLGLTLARESAALDCAVLDVNLNGRSAIEIARALRARSVCFVFVSGYDGAMLMDEFPDVPHLIKPFDHDELTRMVEKEIAKHG